MSARVDLDHRIHVLTRKEELEEVRLSDKVVVVLDVLFATTTMVAALAAGATEVVPVLDEGAARQEAARRNAGTYVLAGELHLRTLPGFEQPTPMALLESGVRGKTLIYSTTNGTVAFAQAASAAHVYCGALLNTRRLAERIAERHAGAPILLACAGSRGHFSFEDFFGAGCMVDRLLALLGEADMSDAARAALLLYRSAKLPESLLQSRIGRIMSERGLAREVEFACRVDAFQVAPELSGGRLRQADATGARAAR